MSDLQDPLEDGFNLVQDEISHFVERCQVLMNVLDVVGQAHPFIQGKLDFLSFNVIWAVTFIDAAGIAVFKIAIKLEMDRRENDARVVTLNLAMCDMMWTLKL